ncbi:MAG TPA: riboflavin biosynthesis protein RibF, partial [Firmicutes bacterium]|nr:riboflavin biosynthesis protein RibF [Bacillota bacterium]
MRIWKSLAEAAEELTVLKAGTAVTIGNFDGVHRGHQRIIGRTIQLAQKIAGQAVVISFSNHSDLFLGRPTLLLNQPSIRHRLLNELGVDVLLEVEFSHSLANLSPEKFFNTWLIEGLKTKAIVIGHDFHFGAGGRGDFGLLLKEGAAKQIIVEQMPAITEKGEVVSSSKIRQLIADGDIKTANEMLGHPFEITGNVVTGEQRGRSLGFPTANIHLEPQYILPAYGVYWVSFTVDGMVLYGVANVGVKPTFGVYAPLIEVYLFDTNLDLYGKEVRVA